MRFRNESSETAPAYAAMIVAGFTLEPGTGYGVVASVRRCTTEDAKLQNHRMIMFNSHASVPGGKRGTGTFSLPAISRIGGPATTGSSATDGDDEPTAFDAVGPVADSWQLWRGGLTHSVDFIEIRDGQRLGIVSPHASPGGWVQIDSNGIPAINGDTPGQADCVILTDLGGALLPLHVNESDVLVTVKHAGPKDATEGKAQIKLTPSPIGWALDVNYC